MTIQRPSGTFRKASASVCDILLRGLPGRRNVIDLLVRCAVPLASHPHGLHIVHMLSCLIILWGLVYTKAMLCSECVNVEEEC